MKGRKIKMSRAQNMRPVPVRSQPRFDTLKKVRVKQRDTMPTGATDTAAGKMAFNQSTSNIPTTKDTMKAFQAPNLQQIRESNLNAQQLVGFRYTLNGGSSQDFTITLPSSGKQLLGVLITSPTTAAISDTSVTFQVNNRAILNTVNANVLNPNYTLGLMYYPTPQELSGKDNIKVTFNKQDVGAATVYFQIVYIPQL